MNSALKHLSSSSSRLSSSTSCTHSSSSSSSSSHGTVTSVVRATPQVNGREQTYPSHQTHTLNRQSPNIAYVIMSTISPRMPHLVKIAPGVTSPHIAKVTAHFFLFFLCMQNLSMDLPLRPLNRF